jgi:hypothetical protein
VIRPAPVAEIDTLCEIDRDASTLENPRVGGSISPLATNLFRSIVVK